MKKHIKSKGSTNKKDERWYQKNLWIVVFLIVFWPLGLYWMWRHAQWKTYAKIIVSALELLFFIIFVASGGHASPVLNLDSSYSSTPKTDDSSFLVSGTATPNDTVRVNGITASRSNKTFKATIPLKEGDNQISVFATDGSKKTKMNFVIHRNTPSEITAHKASAAAAKKVADVAAAKKAAATAANVQAAAAAKAKADAAAAAAKAKTDQAAAAAAVIANASPEEKSALAQATSYANNQYMSQQGVYDQLVSAYGGQFSAEAAQFAIDNVVADWNANALQTAKNYQDQQNLSPAAIHDQLTSQYGEKFTSAQADYAIQHLND